jgi:hypothetical protein
MAKKKKLTIGSVIKGQQKKDDKGEVVFTKDKKPVMMPDYIKTSNNVTIIVRDNSGNESVIAPGSYLNLETVKQQIDSVRGAISAGKLSEEIGGEMLEKLEKKPDFIRIDIFGLVEKK